MIRRLLLVIVCLWSAAAWLASCAASASATVVVDATFASDEEGFDAGTRQSGEGAAGTTGYLSVPSNTTATKSFTAISSGQFRTDFWVRVEDSDTAANNTKDAYVYLLPTSGSVLSSNSITTFGFQRNTAQGSTTTLCKVIYRDNSGSFVALCDVYRAGWVKFSVVANFTGDKFDVYINDVKYINQATWANTSAADFSRVVVLTQTAAPAQDFDELKIEDSYTLSLGESTLVEHDFTADSGEVEASQPDTDNRNQYAQNWLIPADATTYGGMTYNSTNGLAADSSKDCYCIYRCRPEGILEAEFKTSVSGTVWFGTVFRVWAGYGEGALGMVRVYGGSTNTIALFLPTAAGTQDIRASAALTPSANSTYTIKVEMRGRVYVVSYKNAAMDSGSYTVAFTHTVTDSATGGRGVLSEEYAGIRLASTVGATDNYCRKFRFTGAVPSDEVFIDQANYEAELGYGSVRDIFLPTAASPQRRVTGSKGIQCGHRSRADMGNYYTKQDTIYANLCYRQRAANVTEYEVHGYSDCYYTFLRRGPWVADRTVAGGAAENIAPDLDLAPGLWGTDYKALGPTGTSVSDITDSSYSDWRTDIANVALPLSMQRVTTFGSGQETRLTSVVRNNLNWASTANSNDLTHKFLGNLDPISHAVYRPPGDVAHLTSYEAGRAFLIEPNQSALDNTTLIDFRNDVKTPAAISTFTTGSLKTDASGDIDTDGFNERHGWYEITCSGGTASFTFPVASGTRYMPAFRLNSWTSTNTVVTIAGSAGVAGTDYWLDDLGDGNALLQLNSNRTGNTTIALSEPEGGSGLLRALLQYSDLRRINRQRQHFARYGVYALP